MDEDRLVQLQDDEGNDVAFQHLMTIEHEGGYYVVLEAAEDMDDCMEGEAVILKIVQDETGEDMYITIEDEDELKAVYDKCIAALEEEDFESDKEDEDAEDGAEE